MYNPKPWEIRWKKFLYEGMSNQTIDIGELNSIFDFFHISDQRLSMDDYFIFEPRVPRTPYVDAEGNITEDDFTKRVSVAPTVWSAIDAIDGFHNDMENGWMHLYAGKGTPDVDVSQEDCPEAKEMQYGPQFLLSKWLQQKHLDGEMNDEEYKKLSRTGLRPRMLPKKLRGEFENCVPDSMETQDMWLTKPTRLLYIGELNTASEEVILSNAVLSMARKAKLPTEDY